MNVTVNEKKSGCPNCGNGPGPICDECWAHLMKTGRLPLVAKKS